MKSLRHRLQCIKFLRNRKRLNSLKVIVILVLLLTKRREAACARRRWWVRPWLQKGEGNLRLVHEHFPKEDPEQIKLFLRMKKETFDKLLDLVSPYITKQDTNMRAPISARDKLTITLRFLATGETFRSLMYSFKVHESTISLFVPTVCDAIYKVLQQEYMKVPGSAAEWLNISKEFENIWNFPNLLGALDGKHIVFNASRKYGSAYQNYKNTKSIVLLALVDATYNFRYIDVGCNGRVSDGGVFLNSTLYKALHGEENLLNLAENKPLPGRNKAVPFVIVGDGAFSLAERVLKPFPFRNMTVEQRIYNYRLSRARRVVENAFGILANRFRVLLTTIKLHQNKVRKIVKACVVLHNFLRKECPTFVEDEIDESFSFKFGLCHEGGNRYKESAQNIRLEFLDYFNNKGAVPWQNNLESLF